MRQQLRDTESPRTQRTLAPQSAAAVVATPQNTVVAPRQRTPLKVKNKKRFRATPRRVIAGIFAFLFIPWCPLPKSARVVVPSEGNAATVYKQIGEVLAIPGDGKRRSQLTPAEIKAQEADQALYTLKGTPLPAHFEDPSGYTTVEALRQRVARGKAGLALLPKALALPYTDPQLLGSVSRSPHRSITHLRIEEGMLHAIDGEHVAAVEAYLDVVQMGVQLGYGGTHLSGLMGSVWGAMGLKRIGASVAHLTPEQAARLAKRLETLEAQRAPLLTLVEAGRDEVVRDMTNFGSRTGPSDLARVPILRALNHYHVSVYKDAMDKNIEHIRHPEQNTAALLGEQVDSKNPFAGLVPSTDIKKQYESYTKTTELLQSVLQQLHQRAGDGKSGS
ncbi:hypothetical protein [Armatimonas rosea]|uniref:Uncharacterized protein n=1 Tax=Armatimonas rosea TaxID=685828 RepID=A0A7W9W888_ARMRO|nr:hypothetical protein [Armatimonas rosea]MBB6052503.1 hypothetical protein [Armatimonas rosea]